MGGFAASLLLHGALVASVLLAAPPDESLPALPINLTEEISAGAERPASDPERSVRARAPARAPAPPRREERPTVASTDRADAALPVPEPPAVAPPTPVESAEPLPVDPSPAPPQPSPATVFEPTATAPATTTELPSSGPELAGPGGASDESTRPSTSGPPTGVVDGQATGSGDVTSTNSGDPDGADTSARAGQDLALAVPGSAPADPGAMYAGYLGRLRQRIDEALRYPAAARRRGLTGTVTIEVTVLPDGAIGPVRVVESSAHPLLDEAAVDSVRSLHPQPFPRDLPARTLSVRLPVVFVLR